MNKYFKFIIIGLLFFSLFAGFVEGKPNITESNPDTNSNTVEGESQTFDVTINEIANVTWMINGKSYEIDENTTLAQYSNDTASSGIYNITAKATNPNGSDQVEWTWTVTNVPLDMTDYCPDDYTLDIIVDEIQNFLIQTNQNCTIEWFVDGSSKQTNSSTNSASFSTTQSSAGTYNISAEASNPNGTEYHNWTLNVHEKTYFTGNRIWDEDEDMSTTYKWTAETYSKFYYDLDTGLSSETIAFSDIDRNIDDGDLEYSTKPIETDFEYYDFGSYQAIGFMAEEYFAGYLESYGEDVTSFVDEDISVMGDGQLSKVLMDNDERKSVYSGSALVLEKGYRLNIVEVNLQDNSVLIRLTKDGDEVDTSIVSANDIYIYEKDLGSTDDVPIIAVNFAEICFRNDKNTVYVEGIFQISDEYTQINVGKNYGKMQLEDVSSSQILMENDDSISLDEGDTIDVMGNLKIVVADDDTLRFAPFVDRTEPGTYEVRGTVFEDEEGGIDVSEWTPINFEGFYYDIDEGLQTESLNVVNRNGRSINNGNLVYETNPVEVDFEYENFGSYEVIGFTAEKYFTGFTDNTEFANDDISLMSDGQLSKILIDNDEIKTIDTDSPLILEDGYTLHLLEIDKNGDNALVELRKKGHPVDKNIISYDEDFVYEKDVGLTDDVPIITVHFSEISNNLSNNAVYVEGIFQISEDCTDIKAGDNYGRMQIKTVSSSRITMENDDDINLDEGKTVNIMDNIKFKVADDDTLRYYPFKKPVKKLINTSKPINNPVSGFNEPQEFNVTSNQICNFTWKINGDTVQNNISTSSASMVAEREPGFYNITLNVSTSDTYERKTWYWYVPYDDEDKPDLSLDATPEKAVSVNNPASVTISSTDKYPYKTELLIKNISGTTVYKNNITDHVNSDNSYTLDWNATNNSNELVESGKYKIIVKSRDSAGNKAAKNITLFVDNKEPEANITEILGTNSAGSNVYTNSNLTINATASGTYSNLSDIVFQVKSEDTDSYNFHENLNPELFDGTWSKSVDISSIPDDGTYDILVMTKDAAKNVNINEFDGEIILDREPPELKSTIDRMNKTHSRINVNCSEKLKSAPSVKINNVAVPLTSDNGNWTGVFQSETNVYNISMSGTDLSGNNETTTSNAVIENINTSNKTGKVANNKTGTSITFNTKEETNGTLTLVESSSSFVNLSSNLVGSHFLDIKPSKKLAQNISDADIKVKVTDEKVPEGKEPGNISIRYYNESSGDWEKQDTNITEINGTEYWVTNVSHFSVYGTFAEDDIEPIIDNVYPSDGQILDYNANHVEIKFDYSDIHSGINTSAVILTFDGYEVFNLTKPPTCSGGSCSHGSGYGAGTTVTSEYATFNATELDTGPHESSIILYDNAGNKNTHTTQFKVAEKTNKRNDGSSGGGSSGGGSAGGGNTGEKYENIKEEVVQNKYVKHGKKTVYDFESRENKIKNLEFESTKNAGDVQARIEVLKDTSSLVDEKAPGIVYKNMNIWVGKAGFEHNIKNASIEFVVNKSWVKENDIDESTITMCRYHDKTWNELPTDKIEEEDDTLVYESKTPGFSPFAITSMQLNDSKSKLDEPVADFRANTTYGTAPQKIKFTDKSENADKYMWNFGDGETSTETNPSHIYEEAGNYTVTLVVSNDVGNDTYEKTINIQNIENRPETPGFGGLFAISIMFAIVFITRRFN